MPRFALFGVYVKFSVFENSGFFGGIQVNKIEVTVFLVDGEAAVIAHCDDEPFTVGAQSWFEDAQAGVIGGKYSLEPAPFVVLDVVAYSDEVILYLVVIIRGDFIFVCPRYGGTGEVEVFSVGRPGWVGFESVFFCYLRGGFNFVGIELVISE